MTDYGIARDRMVRDLSGKGIKDERVLEAMRRVPRHLFLDPDAGSEAYSDHSFPIGFSQTMSQPYMVAYLAEALALEGNERVLEIGTGSGYQAAVIASMARTVFTVERIPDLASRARGALRELHVENVRVRVGDGTAGWPEEAPFDRILLTAAATEIPERLLMQLRVGGAFLGPVVTREGNQEIVRMIHRGASFRLERLTECAFVPLVRDRTGPDADPPSTNPSAP